MKHRIFYLNFFFIFYFLVLKSSLYLNRHVFVMGKLKLEYKMQLNLIIPFEITVIGYSAGNKTRKLMTD